MNWDRRSRPDTIMRDSSAAICHRYEREGKEGAQRDRRERKGERWRKGDLLFRNAATKTTITQAPGPQLRLACEVGNNYFYTHQESVKHGKGDFIFPFRFRYI